jgi:hypothetical protein
VPFVIGRCGYWPVRGLTLPFAGAEGGAVGGTDTGAGVDIPRKVALGTKGVYDCPRGVEEVPAGVAVGVTFAGAAVGCSELGVAEEAVAGVGEEEVGVTTGAVRDWNIFAMSALLILAATGLAAGALEVVVVG